MLIYKILRVLYPEAYDELINDFNIQMRKQVGILKDRELSITLDAKKILDMVGENETSFLACLFIRSSNK